MGLGERSLSLVIMLAGTVSASAASAQPALGERLVRAHNAERAALGAPPMVWDPTLAAAADAYAAELAMTDRWGHSRPDQRRDQGENLWMGTRGYFALEKMVGEWAAEKAMFRAGVFPNVSKTGSWHDVGHYTQMVWPETRRVGCALRSSRKWDYLVCRYAAAGNVTGKRLGPATYASR